MRGKIALITGATSGIGNEVAKKLATVGTNLILTGRREKRLESIKLSLEKEYGIEAQTLCFDVRNFKEVKKYINQITSKHIDFLINNAGLAMGLSSIEDGKIDHWESMIDTNIKGILYVSKCVIPLMTKHSHIVNIGSIAGKEVYANGNVYCGTKHMVDALNKAFRIDLAKKGIKVSAIHPGAVDTEFSTVRFEGDKERADKVYLGFENLLPVDVAESVFWVLNQPKHVNINDLVIMPTAQPNASTILRNIGL